jgi:O-antigen/teichoic acid export membrane protein
VSIARHTGYNVVGALVPIAVSLVTVPFYVKIVGLERYGILSICWVLVGYFAFFDFGIGRGTAQQLARAGDGESDRNAAFWAGISLSVALAIVAAIVALPWVELAIASLKLGTPTLIAESEAAIPLLVAAIPISVMQSVFRGALEGRRHFLAVNTILSIGSVATAVAPLIAAVVASPAVPVLVATSLFVRLLVLFALAISAGVLLRIGRYRTPRRENVRNLVRFGAWLTITNLVGPLMVFLDRFIIGAKIGPAAVAIYVIPFTLVSQLLVLPQGLGNALFPRFAAAREKPQELVEDALIALSILLTAGSIAAVLLVGPFLNLWIGESAGVRSAPVAVALIIGFWANGLAQVPFARLQGAGRTDTIAQVHLAELLPYLGLLWVGISQFGIVGAAIAWSVRAFVDLLALAVLGGGVGRAKRLLVSQGLAVFVMALIVGSPVPHLLKWGLAALICLSLSAYLIVTAKSELGESLRRLPGLASLRHPWPSNDSA